MFNCSIFCVEKVQTPCIYSLLPFYFTELLDANERFAELRKIVKLMPPHNYAVFKCLMYHLNR